ncbi:hypothetical protein ACROYT_G029576 [Oculina patagonica]
MEKLLQGIVKFRNLVRPSMLPTLQKLANKAQPRMLMITCMDSRLCPTNFTQADPGDMFIVRNPGNIMPHNQLFGENHHSVLSERAALELAISTGVGHIAVCGHSDCKAMTCLYHSHDDNASKDSQDSWVSSWLKRYAQSSLTKFEQFSLHGKQTKIDFSSNAKDKDKLEMMFDEKQNLSDVDKLSQVHVLQQMQNVKSYGHVSSKLDEGSLQLHGLWFNIGSGEMFMYSKTHKRFVVINEETLNSTFGHLINA